MVFGRRTTEVQCYAQYLVKGTCTQRALALLTLTLVAWMRTGLSGFSTVKLPFSPFSLILLFGRKPLSPSHIQIGGRGLSSTSMAGSIYRNYLEFSCNETLPFLHICLFILFHLYQYGVTDIYVILWFIIQFYLMNFWLKVFQLWLEELFGLAHVHFLYTSTNVCVCFRTLFFDITRYSRLIFLTQNQTFLQEVPVLSIIGNWYQKPISGFQLHLFLLGCHSSRQSQLTGQGDACVLPLLQSPCL